MTRWPLLLLAIAIQLQAQTIGRGVTAGSGVGIGTVAIAPPPPPPPTGLAFSPIAGFYVGTQNVDMTYVPGGSGQSIFYTQDGNPATAASTLFTSPVPISSNTTFNALVEKTGSVRQNTQAVLSGGGRKLCAPIYQGHPAGNTAYQNGTPFATCGGGVGSAQPSAWNVSTDGTTMLYSITSTSGAPQILVTLGGSGCDSCTKEAQHFKIQPVLNTHMENIEVDMWHNDGTRNRLHMFGLQCNQQSGINQWQYDNEQGSWQNTGITDHCPMTAGVYVDVVFEGHWIIGDTGCGGLGCTYYDNLIINGVKHVLNKTLESYNPGWGSGCADQKQLDLRPGGTSGSPFTASFNIQQDNVTCSFSTTTAGSATYSF